MTDTSANDESTAQSQRTPLYAIVTGAILVTALVVTTMFGASAAEQLLFGWLYFPMRVSGEVTIDWPAAILGCVCVLVFVICLDRTMRWFAHDSSSWSLRSTTAASFAVVLLFGAGIAMVGMTHQTVWLLSGGKHDATSPQPPVRGLVSTAQTDAINSQFRNDQKQVGIAMHNYTDVARALPPGGTMLADGTLMHGWAVYLGPYIGFTHHDVDFSAPWNSPENSPLYKGAIPGFLHPGISEVFDAEGFALSHIAANSRGFTITTQMPGDNGWSPGGRSLHGLGDTILAGTVATNFRPWGHPANIRDPSIGVNQSPDGFGGPSDDEPISS